MEKSCTPCNKCNAEGTMLGKDHAKAGQAFTKNKMQNFKNFYLEIKCFNNWATGLKDLG